MKRENFLKTLPGIFALPSLLNNLEMVGNDRLPLSSNAYNWFTFFKREGKEWGKDIDADIKLFASSGLTAIEPSFDDVNVAKKYIPVLKKYNIALPSIYVNSTLHIKEEANKSIDNIIETVKEALKYGTKIVVTNPNPIQWGVSDKIKDDDMLKTQAASLNKLGEALKSLGATLSYHTHDMEMKAGAREFHHMLQNTDPRYMTFCYDLHWIYRGSDNSEVAVFDILKMYGKRISELHVRQSTNHIWTEAFNPIGDIDYKRVVKELDKMKVRPHICIEQCIESKTAHTMDAVAAHKINIKEFKSLFNI
jgi:inosose dehydratase